MAEFIENKFWMVLPYSLVADLPELMLSPAAIKDKCDCKPQFLCDHYWQWGWPSVNDSTIPHSPPEAMQFGLTLDRLLFKMRHADPKFGPVRISKADIEDGFYHLFLNAQDCLRLAIVLPRYDDENLNLLASLSLAPWDGFNPLQLSVPCPRRFATLPMIPYARCLHLLPLIKWNHWHLAAMT